MIRRLAGMAPALVVALVLLGGRAAAQGVVLPWGQSSDMIAWQTLAQLMAPSGEPGAHKVEFETWASDQDIYQTSPPTWPTNIAVKRLEPGVFGSFHGMAAPHGLTVSASQCQHAPDPAAAGFPLNGCVGEEVRRNWASFQYIVSNGLYSHSGLANAFKRDLEVDMPADATEFKGDWVRVTDLITWIRRTEGIVLDEAAVHRLYYVSTAAVGTRTAEYALVAFHFSTKQIKNWVWADFEHKMNPGRCDVIGCHDSFGAVDRDVQPLSKPNQNYGDCAKTDKLHSLLHNGGIAPLWQNYCLKGSQVTFVDSSGQPTLLGDSVIERMDAAIPVNQSSCITCHAYASFDRNGNAGLFSFVATAHPVGELDRTKLKGYRQNDFIWGVAKIPLQ